MSWFTDIAGKAEDFLNKIDQNAATALTQATTNGKTFRNKSSKATSIGVTESEDFNKSLVENVSVDNTSADHNGVSSKLFNGGQKSPRSTNFDSKEMVKTGINEQEYASSPETKVQPKENKISHSKKVGKALRGSKSSLNNSTKSNSTCTVPTVSKTSSSPEKPVESDLLEFLNDSNRKDLDEKVGLQNELANQSREFQMILTNSRKLQSENESLKKKLSELERVQDKENNAETEVSLSTAKQEIVELQIILKKKDNEVKNLKTGLDQTLDKLKQLELLQETQNRLEFIEMERNNLIKTNQELKMEIVNLSSQAETSDSSIQSIKNSIAAIESEFATYKEKAKSILKQKDELIASLQDNQFGSSLSIEESPFLPEIDALKSERELLNAELSQSRATIDSLREEVRRLETDVTTGRSIVTQIQRQIASEKQTSSSLQEENLQQRQQVSILQFEMEKEKSERRKLEELRIQSENNEANHQSARVSPNPDQRNMSNNNYSENEDNLRMRITALSQALLEKQSLINNLSSDKQLYQIKVERLQDELRQMGNEVSSNSSGFSHTVVSNQPLYLLQSPWDSGVSTSVKRAFSTVDSLCCQAGVALRRRPNLRLGFCCYIIMLHLWVFFILFQSFSNFPHPNLLPPGQGPSPRPLT